MLTSNLKKNPAFKELVEIALSDYAQWFTDNDPNDQSIVNSIDESFYHNDYWNNPYLDDALTAWKTNLTDLIEGTNNQDDINDANDQIKLIDAYFK